MLENSQILNLQFPSPVESIRSDVLWSDIHLWIKRDDLIHPIISGNKARKLISLPTRIAAERPDHILTMAGNRSNYLHALAHICRELSVPLKAIIRGPEPKILGATLRDTAAWGTECVFVEREEFRQLRANPKLHSHFVNSSNGMWLPEGGSDVEAVRSIMKAVNELPFCPEVIMLPVGTGATALGIALGALAMGWSTKVIGVVVLKGASELEQSLTDLARQLGYEWPENLKLEHNFSGKGFGKINKDLLLRKSAYEDLLNIPLEPIYSTKMMDAFTHYCATKSFSQGQNILLWHTGGLQGNRQ